ncbi:MAG: Ppx/GppA phosphatase family protein, partial [Solirubrobacteraceae bacterium]
AGTPTVLAAVAQSLEPYDPERVHGYLLTAGERDAIFARLKRMGLRERRQVPGLHPDRANVILPGIVILTEVMDLFGLDAIEVSEHDILRGAALEYA